MINQEMVEDVFARLNEFADGTLHQSFVSFQVISDDDDEAAMLYATILSLIHSAADMVILGMPVADPIQSAAKSFLAGVLCGRLETAKKED